MDVVVFTKFVPNPQGTPELGPDRRLVRSAEGALDPGDEYGLELALQLAETEAANVVAISMGPDEAVAAVQRALAMGAHEGVLITDPALRRSPCPRDRAGPAAAVGSDPGTSPIAGGGVHDGYTGRRCGSGSQELP